MIQLQLPFPPPLNSYYRSVALGSGKMMPNGKRMPPQARVMISESGRDYRHNVCVQLMATRHVHRHGTLTDRLAVVIIAYAPDRRTRDLDGMLKGLLDSLSHAKVWQDDSLIDDLRIQRGDVIRGGRVIVSISRIPQPQRTIQGTT